MKQSLLFDITFPNSWKQFQSNISQRNCTRKFYAWNHLSFFRWKAQLFAIFPKFGNLKLLVDVIMSKLGQKGARFVYYIYSNCDKNIKSNDYGFFFEVSSSFWGKFFKIVILWLILNLLFWRHSKSGSEEAQICLSSRSLSKIVWHFKNCIFCNFFI